MAFSTPRRRVWEKTKYTNRVVEDMKDTKDRESMECIQTTNTKKVSRMAPISLCSKTSQTECDIDDCCFHDCLLIEILNLT